jgi:cephalosporin hydroxylase
MTPSDLWHVVRRETRKLRDSVNHRLYVDADLESRVVEVFHKLYYDGHRWGRTWSDTFWLGVQVAKCPLDLWVYQEMLHELRPSVIVETGTAHGGSALFLASVCDLLGAGHVVSIDRLADPGRPAHPRIEYLLGSSTDASTVAQVRARVEGCRPVMVILDSDHRAEHVLDELRIYGPMVTVGSYLVVEDTNLNGHPVHPEFGPGPMEAVERFLAEHPGFTVDPQREKFYLTFNPRGYLRRVARG